MRCLEPNTLIRLRFDEITARQYANNKYFLMPLQLRNLFHCELSGIVARKMPP
jgi:hypothetical protein